MRRQYLTFVLAGSLIVAPGCGPSENGASDQFKITQRFPHDSTAYTQGLLWDDSVLFESVAYVYDAATLAPVDSIQYVGEGWIIVSNALERSEMAWSIVFGNSIECA